MTTTCHLARILPAATWPVVAPAQATTPVQLQRDYEASAGRGVTQTWDMPSSRRVMAESGRASAMATVQPGRAAW